MKIREQGSVVVNNISVSEFHGDIILIKVDLKTKWAEVGCLCNDTGLMLTTTDRSLYNRSENKNDTWIDFEDSWPDYKIWLAQVTRYTLKVVLKKEKKENV